jgi:hypothetical protein
VKVRVHHVLDAIATIQRPFIFWACDSKLWILGAQDIYKVFLGKSVDEMGVHVQVSAVSVAKHDENLVLSVVFFNENVFLQDDLERFVFDHVVLLAWNGLVEKLFLEVFDEQVECVKQEQEEQDGFHFFIFFKLFFF